MATKQRDDKEKLTGWQRFLNLVSGLTAPAIYGAAVTGTLALYYAVFRVGDIKAFVAMLKFVSMQFTPFFMLGYHVIRRVLPDKTLRRTTNLLLPAVEGLLAVGIMAGMMALGLEIDDPYHQLYLYIGELLTSIFGARLIVRNVFKH